jgi:hypothetical protein
MMHIRAELAGAATLMIFISSGFCQEEVRRKLNVLPANTSTLEDLLVAKQYTKVQLVEEKNKYARNNIQFAVGDTSFLLRLDTGASTTFFHPDLCKKLGLTESLQGKMLTGSGPIDVVGMTVPGLQIVNAKDLIRRTPSRITTIKSDNARDSLSISSNVCCGQLGDDKIALNSTHIDLEADVIYMRPPGRVVLPKLRGEWKVSKKSSNAESVPSIDKFSISDSTIAFGESKAERIYHFDIAVLNQHDITSGKCLLIACDPKDIQLSPKKSAPFAYVEISDDKLFLCMTLDHMKLNDVPVSKDAYKSDSCLTLYECVPANKK